MHQYLFGYELPDTVLVLTVDGHCLVLATKKKCEFLSPAKENIPEGSSITGLTLLTRNKADDNAENIATLLKAAGLDKGSGDSSTNGDKKKVGIFKKEWENADVNNGPILRGWQKKLEDADNIELVDCTPGVGVVMSIKDTTELDLMKKSSVLSNKVLKHGVIPRIEEIIDDEKTVTHEELAAEIDAIIENPRRSSSTSPPIRSVRVTSPSFRVAESTTFASRLSLPTRRSSMTSSRSRSVHGISFIAAILPERS